MKKVIDFITVFFLLFSLCSCNEKYGGIVFKDFKLNSEEEFINHIKNTKWFNLTKEEAQKNCILVYPTNASRYKLVGLSDIDDDYYWDASYVSLTASGVFEGIEFGCYFDFVENYHEALYDLEIIENENGFAYRYEINGKLIFRYSFLTKRDDELVSRFKSTLNFIHLVRKTNR